ncbi:MAG: ATP-binding protein, partial [Planctomycetia bacterium]
MTMRFLTAPEYFDEMKRRTGHTADCYVRPGVMLHHMYIDGVKYVVAPAMLECLQEAERAGDEDAIRHLKLHKEHYDRLLAEFGASTRTDGLLGDPPPDDD